MWIQVRSMDGKTCHRIDNVSKLTKIEELRKLLVERFDIPVEQQRLFYRGKQLEDDHTLFEYDVGLNDIIQILKRYSVPDIEQCSSAIMESSKEKSSQDKENETGDKSSASENNHLSKYFQVGDLVDAQDPKYGAWFEAKIVAIKPPKDVPLSPENSLKGKDNSVSKGNEKDDLTYVVKFEDYEDSEGSFEMTLDKIRPRAHRVIQYEEVHEGDKVMVNYNIESPKERGYWYDCEVIGKKFNRTNKQLLGTILIGLDGPKVEKCKVFLVDEIFAIEKNIPYHYERPKEVGLRKKNVQCKHCKDDPSKSCKICSCHVCGGKDNPEKQIMCDECDLPYHLWCLTPPLSELPDSDDWYCPECKVDETEVVRAGEKLKESKKKAKMASAKSSTSRDWGKGMACVGRTKECTLVPPNHFGPIPGVEVGTLWKFRLQVSECGVHRPHVAGIHGRESEGAYSIVLSGGYEDDQDDGEEFTYTGSGGRDLSGNKRCAEQSCDQTLTRMNKALAMNCNAPINKNGAEAKNWKDGKPVRVVRNCKGRKHSKYSPEEGNRYDGIYKVVKYWAERGKSGFVVWRYLLKRDDDNPAPWTKEGGKRIQDLGLTMQYPEGYLETLKEKEKSEENLSDSSKKRKSISNKENSSKRKRSLYQVPSDIQSLIEKDVANKKLWDECLQHTDEGSQKFYKKIEDTFLCICCQELVYQPITTPCFHNVCKVCLKRSFSADVFSCPMCRLDLKKSIIGSQNEILQDILLKLFPGYDTTRR